MIVLLERITQAKTKGFKLYSFSYLLTKRDIEQFL